MDEVLTECILKVKRMVQSVDITNDSRYYLKGEYK